MLYSQAVICEHKEMDDTLSGTLSKLDWATLKRVFSVLAPFMRLQRVLQGKAVHLGELGHYSHASRLPRKTGRDVRAAEIQAQVRAAMLPCTNTFLKDVNTR